MRFYLLLFLFCYSASATEGASGFLAGTKAYQEKNYEKAQEIFTPLLEQYPENPALLYNLGLAEYNLGHAGLALGLWRKARYLDQNFIPATQAIDFVEEQLFPQVSNPSVFQSIFKSLSALPLFLWTLLFLTSAFFFFWFAIEFGAKRKTSPTEWPLWIYSLIPLFIFSGVMTSLLTIDQQTHKATVIEKNLQTHTGPSTESPTLSELQEGEIVIIENLHSGWVQIRTLNGSPGWIPQKSIITFGGS